MTTEIFDNSLFILEVWDDDENEYVYYGTSTNESSVRRNLKNLFKIGYEKVRVEAPDGLRVEFTPEDML